MGNIPRLRPRSSASRASWAWASRSARGCAEAASSSTKSSGKAVEGLRSDGLACVDSKAGRCRGSTPPVGPSAAVVDPALRPLLGKGVRSAEPTPLDGLGVGGELSKVRPQASAGSTPNAGVGVVFPSSAGSRGRRFRGITAIPSRAASVEGLSLDSSRFVTARLHPVVAARVRDGSLSPSRCEERI